MSPRFAIYVLEYLGVSGPIGWWDRVGRTFATYDEAWRYVCEIAGDRTRWIVQPIWGAS